jgi:uncharacterized membrane protein YhfC
MQVATVVVQGFAMVALPVAAAAAARRWAPAVPASALVAGAAAFVGSQVVHVPLNLAVAALARAGALPPVPPGAEAVVIPLALGLSAGVCEETARVVALRGRSTPAEAVVTGVGHGGVEAALLGGVVLLGAVQLAALGSAPEVPPEARAALDAFAAAPDVAALAGVGERASAMTAHVAMSVWVGLAVARRAVWPWAVAVGLHTLLDAAAVAAAPRGIVAAEGVIAAVALVAAASTALALRAWPAPPPPPAAPAAPPVVLARRPLDPRDAGTTDLEP